MNISRVFRAGSTVVKCALLSVFPAAHSLLSKRKIHARDREFISKRGLHVQSGPFAGLKYVYTAVCSSYLPKLIGSYECELHRVLDVAFQKDYRCVIDVGCAEGFYAVGMARRLPQATVFAFDTSYEARALCRRMARINRVLDRVVVRGECTPQNLQQLLSETVSPSKTLVFSDCEGYEKTLLDPEIAPKLRSCDILVEMHDFVSADISSLLKARFSASHDIEIIDVKPRSAEDYESIAFWPHDVQEWALREGRPDGMQWAWMSAKSDSI